MSDHIYWDKTPQPAAAWMPSQEMHRFHLKLMAVRLGLLAALAAGIGVLFTQAGKYTPVLVRTHEGSLAYVTPTRGAPDEKAMLKACQSIVEATFYRTEKGSIPDLKNYLRDGLLARVGADKELHVNDRSYGAGYLQAFHVTSSKVAKADPRLVGIMFTGIFVSRNADRSQANELTIAASFEPVERSARNPLGWELTGLVRAPSEK